MRLVKLLIVTVSAALVLAVISLFPKGLCFESGQTYTFYCGTSSADCRIVTVERGAALEKLSLTNVCGESTEYENLDVVQFLSALNGKIVHVERLSDSVNYYCTADLPYSVNLYGQEINLHISVRGDRVRVASPIIFGGY